MKVIDEIVMSMVTYNEDNPHVYITEEMIRGLIEEKMDELIKEIKDEYNLSRL